ncbi:pyruvate formate lyase family protein [Escherichia coli]
MAANASNDLDACVQAIRCGFGMPAFNNDEIVIPAIDQMVLNRRTLYHDAAIGCIETAVGGKWGYRCTGMASSLCPRDAAPWKAGVMPPAAKCFCHKKSVVGRVYNFDEMLHAWDTQIRYYTRKSI